MRGEPPSSATHWTSLMSWTPPSTGGRDTENLVFRNIQDGFRCSCSEQLLLSDVVEQHYIQTFKHSPAQSQKVRKDRLMFPGCIVSFTCLRRGNLESFWTGRASNGSLLGWTCIRHNTTMTMAMIRARKPQA